VTRSRPVVAIDGPAGAGKSTVTRRVAARLGYLVVDTGALYRAIALAAQRQKLSWSDATGVSALARSLADGQALGFEVGAGKEPRVLLNQEDVSEAIRTPEIGQGASIVSAIPEVRQALLAMQRGAGERGGVVLEGRDIGTVVFPDAEAKFYLTANVDVRARRRLDELAQRGIAAELEDVRREVIERDERDSKRPIAPLRQSPDAELVDSSALDIDQVVDRIVQRVHEIERRLERGSV
jgi:CMP/dCMP kinase